MAAVVGIINRCGLKVDGHHRNQHYKSNVVVHTVFIEVQASISYVYINDF